MQSQPGPLPPDPDKSTDVSTGVPTRYVVDTWRTSLTVDRDVGAGNFKSITAFRHGQLSFNTDTSGFATPNVVFDPLAQNFDQWTQEFNLSGTSFDKLDWLLGVFYLHDDSNLADMIYLPLFGEYLAANISVADSSGPYAFNLSKPLLNLFNIPTLLATSTISGPAFGGGSVIAGDPSTIPSTAFIGFRTLQESQSVAGFAQGTYHVSDRLRLTGGLRYTTDEKDVTRSFHSNLLVALGAAATLCDQVRETKTWAALSGAAGIDYDLAEKTLVYAKYSRGYKAGGFNPGECTGSFDPEYLSAYELGLKSIFADGQFSISAAGFYYDYTNIQFTTFVQNQSAIKNASSAELYGLETDFQWIPVAFEGFSIDGDLSWLHSAYTGGNPFDPDGLFPDPSQRVRLDIRGNELIRAPTFRTSLGAQYKFNIAASGDLTLRGEMSWTNTIYNDIFNGKAPYQSDTTQPAYWLVNARLSWQPFNRHFQVHLFGENLTDSLYANNRVAFNTPQTLVSVTGQFAAPRTFGVRMTLKF